MRIFLLVATLLLALSAGWANAQPATATDVCVIGRPCGPGSSGPSGQDRQSAERDRQAAAQRQYEQERQAAFQRLQDSINDSARRSEQRSADRRAREAERDARDERRAESERQRWLEMQQFNEAQAEQQRREKADQEQIEQFALYANSPLIVRGTWIAGSVGGITKQVFKEADRSTRPGRVYEEAVDVVSPDCVQTSEGIVYNNCAGRVVVLWYSETGPCKSDSNKGFNCAAAVYPGQNVNVIIQLYSAGSGRTTAWTASCKSDAIAVMDGGFWCINETQLDAQPVAEDPRLASYVGNDGLPLAARGGQHGANAGQSAQPVLDGALRLRASQSDAAAVKSQVDPTRSATHCIKWEHGNWESGARYSKFINNCEQAVSVSWLDTEGGCAENDPERFRCSEYPVGAGKFVLTTPLPVGARRTSAACIFPSVVLRFGSEYNCSLFKQPGSKDDAGQ